MPAPKISMEYLFSRPTPARMPNQIQSFWLPVLTMRMSNQAQPIQNSGSNAFMESRLSQRESPAPPASRGRREPWANRLPPSSRAIRPVSSTSPAPATAGKKRIAGSESPKSARDEPGDQRDQRRLIHITPSQMPAAREVIQLVDEIAVMPAGVQVDHELARGKAEQLQAAAVKRNQFEEPASRMVDVQLELSTAGLLGGRLVELNPYRLTSLQDQAA